MKDNVHGAQRDDARRRVFAAKVRAEVSPAQEDRFCASPSAELGEINGDWDGVRQ